MDQNNTQETNTAQTAPIVTEAPKTDGVDEHKLFAILGYILPFLFFIPLISDSSKHNAFARFHANQQLILLVIWVVWRVISGQIFYMMPFGGGYTLMSVFNLAFLVLVIIGVVNAVQKQMKELPVVGGFNLVDKLFGK